MSPSNKSLLNQLSTYILILLAAFLVSFISMYSGLRSLNDAHQHFMERMQAGEQVSSDLEELRLHFQNYRNTWSQQNLSNYESACLDFQHNLNTYRQYTTDSQKTQNYIRRLHNFLAYQLQLLDADNGDSQQESYDLASYIHTSLVEQQSALHEMIQIDLTHAQEAYQVKADQVLERAMLAAILSATFVGIFGLWSLRVYFFVRSSMHRVNEHLQGLADCRWDLPDLLINDYSEFDRLSKTLNMMKNQIRDYVIRTERDSQLAVQLQKERLINEQQRAELIEAQMSTLRAQINPHFLFNALNMIGSASLVETPEQVMKLVEATGKILRYSLYTQKNLVPLDEEVEIVRQYLYLQKHRFGSTLHITLENDLEGTEFLIPPMCIQPIVENCFKHGFSGKKEFKIGLKIHIQARHIFIHVRDNGVGFDPNAIKDKGGIGLSNIEKRLKLQYGSGAEYLFITSRQGNTEITLKIPLPHDCSALIASSKAEQEESHENSNRRR